jgi:hypothetical protein
VPRAECGGAQRRCPAGLGLQAAFAHWALGLLELMLGRPDAALTRLSRLRAGPGEGHPSIALSAAVDLVEAAIRCGEQEHAATTLAMFDRFAGAQRELRATGETTRRREGTPWRGSRPRSSRSPGW